MNDVLCVNNQLLKLVLMQQSLTENMFRLEINMILIFFGIHSGLHKRNDRLSFKNISFKKSAVFLIFIEYSILDHALRHEMTSFRPNNVAMKVKVKLRFSAPSAGIAEIE